MKRFFRTAAIYLFQLTFVMPVLYWVVGIRYRRKAPLPDGPCLIVSNHNSHLDAAALQHVFPLRRIPHVHPVAAADYFGTTWLRRTMAMLLMNAIPIARKPKSGEDPLAPIVDQLKRGESLIFFPEGSRGEAGVVARFRPGIGRLVRELPGLLVVPVFLSGPERVWPRGKLPVPLNIDAHVGAPRTYPAELDAREIADRVRDDVLALAPPRPPVPGPRPAPPTRIALAGIDDRARGEVARALTERLGRLAPTLRLGRPMLEADAEGVRETGGPVPLSRSRTWLKLLAGVFRTGGRFRAEKFAEVVERAAIDESLEHGRGPAFVVGGGSPLVDLLAWARTEFYRGRFDDDELTSLLRFLAGERKIPFRRWGSFLRRAPEVWLFNVLDLARLVPPQVVVRLDHDAAMTMSWLRSLGRELEPHESEETLARLVESYRDVIGALERRRKIRVFAFDPSVPAERVADEVADYCSTLRGADVASES